MVLLCALKQWKPLHLSKQYRLRWRRHQLKTRPFSRPLASSFPISPSWSPLPNAPKILEDAVGVAPDLEWHTSDPNSKVSDKIEDKITQVGWTVFPMSILKECHTSAEFPALIKKAAIYYILVIENCHFAQQTVLPQRYGDEPVVLSYTLSIGFPVDGSIAGLSTNDIWADVANNKDSASTVDRGFARFCFYCDASDDHNGTDESPCPSKESGTILCKLCVNAIGKKNRICRDRTHGHQTHRCTFQWSHHCRKFPELIKPADWSLYDKRGLARGMALADDAMIGAVFRKNIIAEGPIDWTVVADEEKRLEYEATQCSSGEEEEDDQK
ncbi:hypothetical protein HBI25_079230 [Parastagonospora nodorum]|nr:hypothetical protein HBI95_151930 [Parastagonospora nodorum]KAH4294903.1 hypothetical protein HBI01_161910 [Parastagonospora nodorum]KAH4307790.1 hypothetical protein HBI02_113320 [Parastagonospora nodorum]KAH4325386.1 hypothetical protein HBI00_156330 [Parastagonospora nodorum]KAH4363648.1 hypothetical protein HBH94_167000 [Parastagonospora nodorum]